MKRMPFLQFLNMIEKAGGKVEGLQYKFPDSHVPDALRTVHEKRGNSVFRVTKDNPTPFELQDHFLDRPFYIRMCSRKISMENTKGVIVGLFDKKPKQV